MFGNSNGCGCLWIIILILILCCCNNGGGTCSNTQDNCNCGGGCLC